MTRSRKMLLTPFCLALAGALFAGWNSWAPASVPCLTAGCSLYQQVTVAGFSLWWAGAGAFLLLAVLALPGLSGPGRLISGIGLGIDCLLLILMALTLPCAACLTVALLLALCYASFRSEALQVRRNRKGQGKSWLLFVWSLLFVINVGLLARSGLDPWPLRVPEGSEPASVNIFFSPSCGACRELIQGMPEAEAAAAAWYPVAETDADIPVILALRDSLMLSDKPFGAQLEAALAAPPLNKYELLRPKALLLQFRLWRNQTHVLEAGQERLPFVEFHGLPLALLRRNTTRSASAGEAQSGVSLPLELGVAGSCRWGVDCP